MSDGPKAPSAQQHGTGMGNRSVWRDLGDRLAGDLVHDGTTPEFPPGADEPPSAVSRRAFLQLVGASMAFAGVAGCSVSPQQEIYPYSIQPPEVTPGVPSFYATSRVVDGDATGLLVRTNDGRPTKIEGNPDHPASLGASGIQDQASILSLYDPHRAQSLRTSRPGALAGGSYATWETMSRELASLTPRQGDGLRLLLRPQSSPLIGELIARIRARFPGARFTFHTAARQGSREAARLLFGRPLQVQHDFGRANVVLSLDADFLAAGPLHLRTAGQFANRRRPSTPATEMNRLYVVESMLTPTGSIADHRLRRRAVDVGQVAAAIAHELNAGLRAGAVVLPPEWIAAIGAARGRESSPFADGAAADLLANRGQSIVLAGEGQPAEVHALAYFMNLALGNVGRDRLAHRVVAGRRGRRDAGSRGARRRSRARRRRQPGRPRGEPRLRRAGRSPLRRSHRPGAKSDRPRSLRGRDRRTVRLVHPGRPLPRELGSRAGMGRNRLLPAAADRAALRRQERGRDPRAPRWRRSARRPPAAARALVA